MTTRRQFIKTSSGAVIAGGIATKSSPAGFFASGDETLRVGLIGCGGRGTGAAVQALRADPDTKLTAMGDTFRDRIERSQTNIEKTDVADRVEVDRGHQFTGFDCFQKVVDSGVDVVVLASPPHFRAQQIEAAVKAGVHVFAEKPVAVDAPGVRRVLAACEEAKKKKLSVVSGLCYRYHPGRRAIMEQIHSGAIGDITALNVNYVTGELWHHGRQPGWSEMEFQVRNWLYFTWLSGDHIAEQHIHSLDVAAWAMGDKYPVRALSMGGRQVRTDPKFGNVYDHFATVYEFENGVKCFSLCRQQNGCAKDVSDHVIGSKGRADIFRHRITGENTWRYRRQEGRRQNMYQVEHDELFASIRKGEPINNGEYMCKSTLMAIMGRMAAYTGQRISWQQALDSKEDLTPTAYKWGEIATAPVAKPGVTKFS